VTVAIARLLEYDTAGDPITGLKWSHRTTAKIAAEIRQQYGIDISPNTVARLLHQMDYSLRVNQKKLATDHSADRNLQFDYINDSRHRFQRGHLPLISVDSKKRELVGNFSNRGTRWVHSPRLVYDHDFRTDARGIALPYGIYDPRANRGSIVVGVSHDTPAFAVHAIAHWWRREGLLSYPRSRQLLILADTGGSNNCRYRTWKTELQTQLANPFHLTVTVAHYPTGTSKWNPIEHRLFSEISKNWAGEPLDSYQKILNFIRTTSTKTGLSVSAYLDRRRYQTEAIPTPEQLRLLRLCPHDILPKWNYSIKPSM
jgi:Rhodopirellula transposase DDE domain/Winged helix-turn helix